MYMEGRGRGEPGKQGAHDWFHANQIQGTSGQQDAAARPPIRPGRAIGGNRMKLPSAPDDHLHALVICGHAALEISRGLLEAPRPSFPQSPAPKEPSFPIGLILPGVQQGHVPLVEVGRVEGARGETVGGVVAGKQVVAAPLLVMLRLGAHVEHLPTQRHVRRGCFVGPVELLRTPANQSSSSTKAQRRGLVVEMAPTSLREAHPLRRGSSLIYPSTPRGR